MSDFSTHDYHIEIYEAHAFEKLEGLLVATCDGQLVTPEGKAGLFWDIAGFQPLADGETPHFLGVYGGNQVFVVEVSPDALRRFDPIVLGLRQLLGQVPDGLFRLLGRALQIADWYSGHAYCGYCGGKTRPVPNERAMGCESCRKIYFPRISPCIMALIHKGDYCLLARHGLHRGFHTVLAGFIEPGESAEGALHREVAEEVGLKVDNLKYVASQPWPFPGQLMLGYFAAYKAGEIQVDGVEIVDADWFHYAQLPEIPGDFTLSGQLIRQFIAERSGF